MLYTVEKLNLWPFQISVGSLLKIWGKWFMNQNVTRDKFTKIAKYATVSLQI